MEVLSNSLWRRIVETTEQALATGALQPISTQIETVPDGGVPFCVRVVDSLVRKEAARNAQNAQKASRHDNPFLPYEEALWVAHLSETHACLLNKFNVVEHHILIVTRHYESQETWLTEGDFEALAACLITVDGLGFYNGGRPAGASQHHKHLQLVPYGQAQGLQHPPISELIDGHRASLRDSTVLDVLPFRHSIRLLSIPWSQTTPAAAGAVLMQAYRRLVADIGLSPGAVKPDVPYNLLITRDWMVAVPRSQGSYQTIGVNSLGYAGWLLTKNQAALHQLKRLGPMALLSQVGIPRA